MAARSNTRILRALTAKGFVDSGGDHHSLSLHVDGEETVVHTKVSRGRMDYGDNLLSLMKHQLHVTASQLLRLIDCPLDGPAYVSLLREQGVLEAPATEEPPTPRPRG